MCKENYPVIYFKFLEMHEKKRAMRNSLTAIEKARLRLNAIQIDSDDVNTTVVEQTVETVVPEEPRKINFFDYKTLISIFVRKFGFCEEKNMECE